MNPNQSYPAAGEVIDGKYQVEHLLGEGGMGAVAKATHLLRRAPVALKFMSPNVIAVTGAVERFLNEGVAASQIDSENVVHVFDVGKLPNGAPYLVMEYMEGRDLAQVIEHEGHASPGHPGIDVPRAVYFIVQALRGLQVAHEAGIIHRDMKPSNCFVVNKEGEADFVKLLDFGISKVGQGAKSASLTQTNSALGTPLYMSPEQARSPRDVDLRSDLYSVGVILYELLTGKTPFTSESGEFTEILFKLFTQDPPPIRALRPEVSPELAAAVHRALVRDPNERYATAAEFALALEPFTDARSARVLQRMRAHTPGRGAQGRSLSNVHAAEPVAAFSKLSTGTVPARTNDMPGAPPRAPAETQKLAQGAPAVAGMGAATAPLGQAPAGRSGYPPAMAEARVQSAAEAIAATQLGGPGLAPPGAQSIAIVEKGKQTDLGASRDTSVAVPIPGGRGTSPLVYLVPAALLLVGGGVGIFRLTAKPAQAPTEVEARATLRPEPPPAPTVSTAVVLPPAEPSALPVAPDAGATAAPAKKNGLVAEPLPRPSSTTARTPRLGDLKIHE